LRAEDDLELLTQGSLQKTIFCSQIVVALL